MTVDELRPLAAQGIAEAFDLELEELPADDASAFWPQPIHAKLAAKR